MDVDAVTDEEMIDTGLPVKVVEAEDDNTMVKRYRAKTTERENDFLRHRQRNAFIIDK